MEHRTWVSISAPPISGACVLVLRLQDWCKELTLTLGDNLETFGWLSVFREFYWEVYESENLKYCECNSNKLDIRFHIHFIGMSTTTQNMWRLLLIWAYSSTRTSLDSQRMRFQSSSGSHQSETYSEAKGSVIHDSSVGKWIYITICPLRGASHDSSMVE